MKMITTLVLMFSMTANAESIRQIFENISETAVTGNGDGHDVYQIARYSEKTEISKLDKQVNKDSGDCDYGVYAGVDAALETIKKEWDDTRTANRLAGLNGKGLIRQILYSEWDSSTGDSLYCLMSTIKVFGVDGTVLELNYNETD